MKAVVMAAGEGRRLRPLTERWPKPVLPIDGKPVVGMLLRELHAAGCEEAVVVTGHLAEQVEALLGDGTAFGVPVRYARQPGVLGSADAVLRAQAEPPYLVVAADTVFRPGDVLAFWNAFAAGGADGAIAVRRDPPPDPPHRFAVRVENGLVTRVLDDDPANPLAGAPLWALGPRLQPLLERLPGREPWELATVFEEALRDGLAVSGIEIGATRDLTRPEDLVVENVPYLRSSAR
jgi:NDP-sugar pyrophosphorylase family protein